MTITQPMALRDGNTEAETTNQKSLLKSVLTYVLTNNDKAIWKLWKFY